MIWLSLRAAGRDVFLRLPARRLGLRLRAVGEHPRAADTVGISVYKVRYIAVIPSGAIAAMGGAYLSLGFVHSFNQGMTNGMASSALAALIFGKWRPFPPGARPCSSASRARSPIACRRLRQPVGHPFPGVAVPPDADRSCRSDRPFGRPRQPPGGPMSSSKRAARAAGRLRCAGGARDSGRCCRRPVPRRRRAAPRALRHRARSPVLALLALARARRARLAGARSVRRAAASRAPGRFLVWAGLYAAATGALALGIYGALRCAQ